LKDYENQIELIADFEFNNWATNIEVSNDGYYLVGAGTYPPRIKIFETQEMSVKCERGIDAEILKVKIISDDYSKIAMLLGKHDQLFVIKLLKVTIIIRVVQFWICISS
jgi:ribosome biogenesis protein ENP2